ncbi:hypothetical protein [Piscinibacter sakaiensis]|uniref:Uncharacterized protein n=1 Tax=Piscinibacter sakaiensis TaxID=1547922 RepID=A0A0K8P7Z4_PISS1|nr:hypothetical protein [Piscinibacter sakaiensis]GAP38751.1 hypothetical protein ISF6_5304 [Piscinibacter sakaiensis]
MNAHSTPDIPPHLPDSVPQPPRPAPSPEVPPEVNEPPAAPPEVNEPPQPPQDPWIPTPPPVHEPISPQALRVAGPSESRGPACRGACGGSCPRAEPEPVVPRQRPAPIAVRPSA